MIRTLLAMAVKRNLLGTVLSIAVVYLAVSALAREGRQLTPIASPLAPTNDPLGAELQKTFISAPVEIASARRGTFIAYRKNFSIPNAPSSASLHLFADARYLVWLNGEIIHRGPARFDFHGPEYDSLELGGRVHVGENTLAIVVMGNGGEIVKLNDGMGLGHNARMMKHISGLTLRLDINGLPFLRTDETWKWNDKVRYQPAKIDWANIVDRIDTRVEERDWTLPGYDDRAWASVDRITGSAWGPLTARRIPLLRDTPVHVKFDGDRHLPITLAAGEKLDFSIGRLVQAYTILDLEAETDTHLKIEYAGVDYVARRGRQRYISSDTRAFADGSISVQEGRVTILGLKLVERLYPFERKGSFRCNDERLDRLWMMCARSLELLSEDAYVDCADRERAEWMDEDPPAFDLTRTAFAGKNSDGSLRYADARLLGALLRRTALSIQPDGWVKAHTCSDRFDIHAKMEDRACDWVQGARRYFESCGDLSLIREIWPVIVRQMDWFLSKRTTRGLVLAREWVVWGNPVGYVTCEGAGINAFVYRALVDAAYLGHAIGDVTTAARFAQAASALSDAFDRVLWDEREGNYASAYYPDETKSLPENSHRQPNLVSDRNRLAPTLFSALWALDQGIVPESKRELVHNYLVRHRSEAKRVMTYYYLFKQLYIADTLELDHEVLNTLRGKWADMTASPWQASWEEFTGESKAHIYGMFPGYFLSAYVLGVRPTMPASRKHLVIEPRLGDLDFAEGEVITEFGPVPVSWKSESGRLVFSATIPEGVTAELRLPMSAPGYSLQINGRNHSGQIDGRWLKLEITSGTHNGVLDYLK